MAREVTPKFSFPFSNDGTDKKLIIFGNVIDRPDPLGPLGCMEFFEDILHMLWTLDAGIATTESKFGDCSFSFENGAFFINNGEARKRI